MEKPESWRAVGNKVADVVQDAIDAHMPVTEFLQQVGLAWRERLYAEANDVIRRCFRGDH